MNDPPVPGGPVGSMPMESTAQGDQPEGHSDQRPGGYPAAGTTGTTGAAASAGTGAFGPNAWLVEDMYDRYQADPTSVSDSWREFFADYRPAGAPPTPTAAAAAAPAPARSVLPGASVERPHPRPGPTDGPTNGATPPPGTARCRPLRCRRLRRRPRRPPRSEGRPGASWPTWRRRSGCPPPPACGSFRPSCSRSTGPSSTTNCSGPRAARSASPT